MFISFLESMKRFLWHFKTFFQSEEEEEEAITASKDADTAVIFSSGAERKRTVW